MRALKNHIILLSSIVSFILIGNESEAQLTFRKATPFSEINTSYLQEEHQLDKRRGFKKRRYGRHTFFVEGGYFAGYYTGKRYSINYDILAQASESNALTIRIGYGRNEATNDSTYLGGEKFIPLGINILIGRKNQFEVALGGYYYTVRKILTPYLSLGFRHQNPKGGFMYRLALDMHLERVLDTRGNEIQKTAVYGPLIGLGWTF